MFRLKSLRLVGMVTACAAALLCVANAQEKKAEDKADAADLLVVDITKVETEWVNTPQIGTMSNVISSAPAYIETSSQWLAVEFAYTVPMPPKNEEGEGYVDELTFQVGIEGRMPETIKGGKIKKAKSDEAIILAGEVTYVNIRKTTNSQRERVGVVFIHPDVVARYLDKNNISSKSTNIRVSAKIGGKEALNKKDEPAVRDLKENDAGWAETCEKATKISGLVLKKSQTPFAHVSASRYPMEKLPADGGGK